MHAHSRGYVGICPVEQNVINVCGLLPSEWIKRTRGSIDAALSQWGFEPQGCAQLQGAAPRGAWQTTSEVTCQSAAPSVAGVLYVGDAQGTIEPVAGQGMTLALGSAALAASLLAHVGPDGVDRTVQVRYQAAWEAAFARPAGTSRRLGWLLRHPALLRGVVPLFDMAPTVQRYLLQRAFRAMRVELAPMIG
jgi:menaquinone-9 beta-reductase